VSCRTSVELAEPIVGFVLRDRLGQVLFGQNTCVSNTVVGPIAAGSSFEVVFEFWMPMLNSGDYAIGVALAEGSQQLHTQHHWINDALIVKSCPDEVCYGSVGVEVIGISFRSKEHGEPCYDRGGSSIVL
jgi:lipopolysaccharide transport system ATP-binding protein